MVTAAQTNEVRQDLSEIKKNATYSLPINVWLWLKEEAIRRNSDASSLIVEMVQREQEAQVA